MSVLTLANNDCIIIIIFYSIRFILFLRRCSAIYTNKSDHIGNSSSSRSPPSSTRRCLDTLPAVWLTTATSSPTPAQEDCARLTLVRFLSVGPTSATESTMQLDPESGTICRRTSDSRTCHTAVSDSRWRRFYLVCGTKVQCESPFKLHFRNPFTYLHSDSVIAAP